MSKNIPNKYIIHHSLTEDNKILKDFSAIKNYHVNVKGWVDIGYHMIIEEVNGVLKAIEGRKPWVNGAHTIGQNEKSIGICCVGNFDSKTPSEKLYKFTAETIFKYYVKGYNFGMMPVKRHSDYANYKSCPGKKFKVKKIQEYLIHMTKIGDVEFMRELKNYERIELDKAFKYKAITDLKYWENKIKNGDNIQIGEVLAICNNIYEEIEKLIKNK